MTHEQCQAACAALERELDEHRDHITEQEQEIERLARKNARLRELLKKAFEMLKMLSRQGYCSLAIDEICNELNKERKP